MAKYRRRRNKTFKPATKLKRTDQVCFLTGWLWDKIFVKPIGFEEIKTIATEIDASYAATFGDNVNYVAGVFHCDRMVTDLRRIENIRALNAGDMGNIDQNGAFTNPNIRHFGRYNNSMLTNVISLGRTPIVERYKLKAHLFIPTIWLDITSEKNRTWRLNLLLSMINAYAEFYWLKMRYVAEHSLLPTVTDMGRDFKWRVTADTLKQLSGDVLNAAGDITNRGAVINPNVREQHLADAKANWASFKKELRLMFGNSIVISKSVVKLSFLSTSKKKWFIIPILPMGSTYLDFQIGRKYGQFITQYNMDAAAVVTASVGLGVDGKPVLKVGDNYPTHQYTYRKMGKTYTRRRNRINFRKGTWVYPKSAVSSYQPSTQTPGWHLIQMNDYMKKYSGKGLHLANVSFKNLPSQLQYKVTKYNARFSLIGGFKNPNARVYVQHEW